MIAAPRNFVQKAAPRSPRSTIPHEQANRVRE